MNLEIEPSLTSDTAHYIVTLSSRNLKTLLLKLLEPDSKRTLFVPTKHGVLYVIAESDEVHYGNRAYGPGKVHPREEAALKRDALRADEGLDLAGLSSERSGPSQRGTVRCPDGCTCICCIASKSTTIQTTGEETL